MRINLLLLTLVAVSMNNTLFACEIVQKRSVHQGLSRGVAGVCSNNGGQIECLYSGENSGGLTCTGPEGSNSGPDLKNLIFAVCGCGINDRSEEAEQQIEQELE